MTVPTPDLPDWTRTSAVIDSPQLIIDTAGLVPMPYNSPVVDVSRFRSVRVIPTVAGGAAAQFADIGINWQQGAEQGPGDQYGVWDTASGPFTPNPPAIYLPVRGNQLSVDALQIGGASKVDVKVYGSLLDQPAPVVAGLNTPQPGVLAAAATLTLAAGASQSYYCGPTAGDLWLSLECNSGKCTLFAFGEIQFAGTNAELQLGQVAVTAPGAAIARLGAPGMPLRIQVENFATTSASVQFAVTEAH